MFGITHWIIVLLIALIVFGPEKLPELARTIGKALAEFRRASADFRRVIEDELYEMERQTREKERQAAAGPSPSAELPAPSGTIAAGTIAPPPPTEPIEEQAPAAQDHAGKS